MMNDDWVLTTEEIEAHQNWIGKPGVTRMTRDGKLMTIIRFKDYWDFDVQFEDGKIVEHVKFSEFDEGVLDSDYYFKNSPESVGEVKWIDEKQMATLIRYGSDTDIDVQFEDGTILKNIWYVEFRYGLFEPYGRSSDYGGFNYTLNYLAENSREKWAGKVVMANCGLKMKILEYYSSQNVTVLFEDLTVVRQKTFSSFKKGSIGHPKFKRKNKVLAS